MSKFFIFGVLLAEGLWVFLHLLQDHAHGRVTHDLLHLWIGHGPPFHVLWIIIPHGLTHHAALHPLCGLLHAGTHKPQ